ncbi:MAG: hypothetical protein SangKO_059540 [Sandaracinaceae bacterium]
MGGLARSGIGAMTVTLAVGCALSHGAAGAAGEEGDVRPLTVACADPWGETFAETGQHARAVDFAAEAGVSDSCGCFGSGLSAPSSDADARAALDCFCEAARTCTPRHGRGAFYAAETAILMDYFVAPAADGGCTVEVLTGDYSYFDRVPELSREACATLTCAEDDRGHLRGSLTACVSRDPSAEP